MFRELGNGSGNLSDQDKALEVLRNPEHLPTRREGQRTLRTFETEDYGDVDGKAMYRSFVKQSDFEKVFGAGDAQEVLNEEFIDTLSDHLLQFHSEDKQTVILEVGAGSGRLAHFLSEALNKKA